MCCQAVSNVGKWSERVAQLLHLFWCAARPMFVNENQRVAQLLHLFWCAARLFQMLVNENQGVAQLLHLFWCAASQCC